MARVSEEEKEAIEKLKKLANKRLFEEMIYEDDLISFTEYAIINNLIDKLQKENEELKEENEKINKAADKMYEYISYYGWEDFESNTGCNREEMVDYFYKE